MYKKCLTKGLKQLPIPIQYFNNIPRFIISKRKANVKRRYIIKIFDGTKELDYMAEYETLQKARNDIKNVFPHMYKIQQKNNEELQLIESWI